MKPPANQVPNQINMYSQYLTPTTAVAPNQLQDFPTPGQFMTANGAVIPFVQPRPKNDKLEVSIHWQFYVFCALHVWFVCFSDWPRPCLETLVMAVENDCKGIIGENFLRHVKKKGNCTNEF